MTERPSGTRRQFLAASGALSATALAGCTTLTGDGGGGGSGGGGNEAVTLSDFRGSGPLVESRPAPGGAHIEELPALKGELTVYLGGGEGGGLYLQLVELLEQIYPEFEPKIRQAETSQLANQIVEEMKGGDSPADVFWAIDAGALGYVASAGYTRTLPARVTEPVPKDFHPNDQWVGVAGRARSVPYNTEKISAKDVPADVFAFTEERAVPGQMAWAPTYPAFQAFVTAMRVINGEAKTKRWLKGMMEQGIARYRDEWFVSNAVADGEVTAGFANHYYAVRVMASRKDAPIDIAFTKNDAGALVNASGAEIVKGTQKPELAADFVRHLLSAEAQEFFATRTFAYPMIPEVSPVGPLPTIDELNPPEFNLAKLSNLKPTVALMKEVGVL